MGMTWQDAAKVVTKVAPAVATAVGSPAAGVATSIVTKFIADALGIEQSPDALIEAVQDPQKLAELKRLDREYAKDLERMRIEADMAAMREETMRLDQINQTLRAELGHEGWFKSGWRPFIGWMFGMSMASFVATLAYHLTQDPSLIGDPEFTGMVVWIFVTMGAALGIQIDKRSKDKWVARGVEPKGFLSQIATLRKK